MTNVFHEKELPHGKLSLEITSKGRSWSSLTSMQIAFCFTTQAAYWARSENFRWDMMEFVLTDGDLGGNAKTVRRTSTVGVCSRRLKIFIFFAHSVFPQDKSQGLKECALMNAGSMNNRDCTLKEIKEKKSTFTEANENEMRFYLVLPRYKAPCRIPLLNWRKMNCLAFALTWHGTENYS